MFAILETGGKQYKVAVGEVLEVERIDAAMIDQQKQVVFESVLLIQDDDLHLGHPYVENGVVRAHIVEEVKATKIIVFKKKAKKGYKRTQGHRQKLHRIAIDKIEILAEPLKPKTETAEKKVATAAKSVKKPASKTADKPAAKSETAKKTSTAKKPASKTADKKPASAKATADKPAAKSETAKKTSAVKKPASKTAAKPKAKPAAAKKTATKTATAKKPASKTADKKENN